MRATVARADITDGDTQPLPGGRRRSRRLSPRRSAVRQGALAAGLTGGALALVAPPTLELAAQQDGALALSTRQEGLGAANAVSPAAPASPRVVGGATSADLIKASDRQRRQAQAVAQGRAEADRRATQARDQARAAEKQRTSASCGISSTYGGVAGSVQAVGNAVECLFPSAKDVLGVGARASGSDHPGGYALDIMTPNGNPIANCVMANQDALGVKYAIYNRRINTGSGWEGMEDRGGVTANHEDHVHVSFERGRTPDVSVMQRCS